ncbi:MAG: hypothetical protein U1F77_14785 [Kiritimatiellia bacterium]
MKTWNPVIALALSLLCLAARAEDKYDVLSVHKTKATFEGLRAHRCMGRTSLCPDQCGHSGTLAVFKIDEYTVYEKKGEYGDPKQETFQFMTEDNLKNAKVPAELLKTLQTLKPGDKVLLEWEHRYMNRDGSRWPERPVTRLEKPEA